MIIFLSVLKDKIKESRHTRVYNQLKPSVLGYIEDGSQLINLQDKLTNTYIFRIVLEIMLEYAKENDIEMIDKFEELGCVEYLIRKAQRGVNLDIIRTFGIIKSPKMYGILFSWTDTDDFEEKYMSFYALSLLRIDRKSISNIIDKLIPSDVTRDRKIEIINNFNLSIDEYLAQLSSEKTEQGKVVFLRVIQSRKEITDEIFSDQIVNCLYMGKEVRISAVLTLASSQNIKYLPLLAEIYESEKEWEVRAAIAKSLVSFPPERIIEILKKMIYDEQWWVRFNAVEVLARIGSEGIDLLIDLSLDESNEKVSNLAYYILNSNKNVYETIQNY